VQYVAAVDSAAGLADGDASCCSILKIQHIPGELPKVSLVAQFHGWAELFDYADEVKKGAVYYNNATVIVELTGGYGRAVLLRLKKQIGYWNIFLDSRRAEQLDQTFPESRHGVDTNVETKPMMIGALQTAINKDILKIPCQRTITELNAFGQERTESGLSVRFRGMGEKDDRVMSLAIGMYVILSRPDIYQFYVPLQPDAKPDNSYLGKLHESNEESQNPFRSY
jgi:hypothetical protein